jgi:hypothetical protein
MCAAVTVMFGVCVSVGLLELLVVVIRKWPIDPISNPKPCRETLLTRDSIETPLRVGNI